MQWCENIPSNSVRTYSSCCTPAQVLLQSESCRETYKNPSQWGRDSQGLKCCWAGLTILVFSCLRELCLYRQNLLKVNMAIAIKEWYRQRPKTGSSLVYMFCSACHIQIQQTLRAKFCFTFMCSGNTYIFEIFEGFIHSLDFICSWVRIGLPCAHSHHK